MKISPQLIFEKIDSKVIGQKQAKKAICNAVFMHYVKCYQHVMFGKEYTKNNLLLMGNSGCGKTLLTRETVKALRDIVGDPNFAPLLELDSTNLSATGWVGNSIEDVITEFFEQHDEPFAKYGIVFLDEFDKICVPAVGTGGTDHNKKTLYGLLKAIEGKTVKTKISSRLTSYPDKNGNLIEKYEKTEYKTDNMLFLFAGNFKEVREKRGLKDTGIGYHAKVGFKEKEQYSITENHQYLDEMGVPTQIVGRIGHVAEIKPLSFDELYSVLEEITIPELLYRLAPLDLNPQISEEMKKSIVEDAILKQTGARGLAASLEEKIEDEIFKATLYVG